MAIDIVGTCASAVEGVDTPALATGLTIVFGVYILLDSVLAAHVITRKAAEAEAATAHIVG